MVWRFEVTLSVLLYVILILLTGGERIVELDVSLIPTPMR